MDITCSVCTESLISKDDSVSTTRCGHVFHTKCVTQWFQTGKNNCPQCRSICGMNQMIQTYFIRDMTNMEINYLVQMAQNSFDMVPTALMMAPSISVIGPSGWVRFTSVSSSIDSLATSPTLIP